MFFFLKNRYTKIWTQPPPGNILNPQVTSWSQLLSQGIASAQWQAASWSGFRQGTRFSCLASACLCLEMFTVTWLSSRNNRQMLNCWLLTHFFINKESTLDKSFWKCWKTTGVWNPPGTRKLCLTPYSDREAYPTVLIRLFQCWKDVSEKRLRVRMLHKPAPVQYSKLAG